jgi:hypothetical protein
MPLKKNREKKEEKNETQKIKRIIERSVGQKVKERELNKGL